jgi:hypothetical protein
MVVSGDPSYELTLEVNSYQIQLGGLEAAGGVVGGVAGVPLGNVCRLG